LGSHASHSSPDELRLYLFPAQSIVLEIKVENLQIRRHHRKHAVCRLIPASKEKIRKRIAVAKRLLSNRE
jgi:hypothetical protein